MSNRPDPGVETGRKRRILFPINSIPATFIFPQIVVKAIEFQALPGWLSPRKRSHASEVGHPLKVNSKLTQSVAPLLSFQYNDQR
jgi:hypothetical protein